MTETLPSSDSAVRILLVDDYVDAVEMWALYLRLCGYEVLTASDGLAAVEATERHLPHLVILDLDLPGISGFEAARRIRDLPATRHIPLLAATGYSHLKQLNEARGAGFDAVLIKPCEPVALVKEVERVLAKVRPGFVPPGNGAAHFG
jgi:two-component system, cell cycle response regulator DivK